MGISFVSGNVSFYNESHSGAIPPTPTILGVGLVEDIRQCVTSDFKQPGNTLYQIGKAEKEMGGSEYYTVRNVHGNQIPRVNPHHLQTRIKALLSAMKAGYIVSCHDISQGGLAVCLCEMALGGNKGCTVSIPHDPQVMLFSESNSRFVIEVKQGKEKQVEDLFGADAHNLGTVTAHQVSMGEEIDLSLKEIRTAWQDTLWKVMG
jgi:phosphoribosylformylglycinamidine synthase